MSKVGRMHSEQTTQLHGQEPRDGRAWQSEPPGVRWKGERRENHERRHTCLQQARYATDGLHYSDISPRGSREEGPEGARVGSSLPTTRMATKQSQGKGALGCVVVVIRGSVHALGAVSGGIAMASEGKQWWGEGGADGERVQPPIGTCRPSATMTWLDELPFY